MNLLEKLNPEALEVLKRESVKYPHSIDHLKQRLFSMNFWVDVKIADAYTLCKMNKKQFGILELASLFNE